MLFVPDWIIAIWVLLGKSILPARHRMCCTLSPPIPRLKVFGKYFLHAFGYFLRSAAMEFPIFTIDWCFSSSNPLYLPCALNYPGFLLRGVANISIVFFSYDVQVTISFSERVKWEYHKKGYKKSCKSLKKPCKIRNFYEYSRRYKICQFRSIVQ